MKYALLLLLTSTAYADDWWNFPTTVALKAPTGCRTDAAHASIALKFDKTSEGRFVEGITGATGALWLAPGAVSAARIDVGMVHFDTILDLDATRLHLKKAPAPLAGILATNDFRVAGGDRDTLVLAPSRIAALEWVDIPTLKTACGGLGGSSEKPTVPGTPREISKEATIELRATPTGSVLARLTRTGSVNVVEKQGAAVKIAVALDNAALTAWTDEAQLLERVPDKTPTFLPGEPNPHVRCKDGAQLGLRADHMLFIVGWVRGAQHIEVEPLDGPWFTVRDSLGIPGFGQYNVDGALVVPKAACVLDPR